MGDTSSIVDVAVIANSVFESARSVEGFGIVAEVGGISRGLIRG